MQHKLGFSGTQYLAKSKLVVLLIPTLLLASCDFLNTQPETPQGDEPGTVDPGPDPDPDPDPDPGPDPIPLDGLLTRAPYLQMLAKTSVVVVFRTAEAVTVEVDYGTTSSFGSTTSGGSAQKHAVALTGLTPGQRYYYRLRVGSDVLVQGGDYFFDTDAGVGDDEFSFFTTGDIGQSGGKQEETAARILQTSPRAEMGLICGDVVYPDGESGDYDSYLMKPWATMMSNMAIYPALGNHDWHVDPENHFVQEWVLPNNEHYYSYDRGNAHFIALDTRDGDIYDRAAQVEWLRADLEANKDAQWTFVYYHHPGYTCTYKGNERSVIDNFHPLFDEYGVDVVFMGHAHTYERLYPVHAGVPLNQNQEPNYTDPQGTIYIVSGCGAKLNSSTTRDCDLNAVAIDGTFMFTHVNVRGAVVTIRTIESLTGVERDTVTINKSAL